MQRRDFINALTGTIIAAPCLAKTLGVVPESAWPKFVGGLWDGKDCKLSGFYVLECYERRGDGIATHVYALGEGGNYHFSHVRPPMNIPSELAADDVLRDCDLFGEAVKRDFIDPR